MRKFQCRLLSQRFDMCLNIPLRRRFSVVTWRGTFFFYVYGFLFWIVQTASWLTYIVLFEHIGPTEGSDSHSGQQARCEGLDDGGRNLPVPHPRFHHNTLMARPTLLCSDRRRVSGTHASRFLSFWRHQRESSVNTKFLEFLQFFLTLSLSLSPVYQPVWTGWSPGLSQTRTQLRLNKLSLKTEATSKQPRRQPGYLQSCERSTCRHLCCATSQESAMVVWTQPEFPTGFIVSIVYCLRHDLRCELLGTSYQTSCSTLVRCLFTHLWRHVCSIQYFIVIVR